jgi:carbon-monoxide dehydrogenase small subunit
MNELSLNVNGADRLRRVEPRTHLADFLRDDLNLTGTHIGCEHGVCGACTLLLDGEPVRACITPAVACQGRAVRTIEGLEDDPVMVRLRDAFTCEHALQCGYCTPGMLVTARDIVMRLPGADDARIRLELSGNLCRCTGYQGIVAAIRRVLDDAVTLPRRTPPAPVAEVAFAPTRAVAVTAAATATARGGGDGSSLREAMVLPRAAAAVWQALRDPTVIVACVPGARIIAVDGDKITGEMTVAFGPIRASFAGTATVVYDDAAQSGRASGQGRDRGTGGYLDAAAAFSVAPDGRGTRVDLVIDYALQGPLAQFNRPALVRVFAAEMVARVARNLDTALGDGPVDAATRPLRLGGFVFRAVWHWLKKLVWRR